MPRNGRIWSRRRFSKIYFRLFCGHSFRYLERLWPPSWWGSDWLVIATSYSGNTEETLDGVKTALEQGGTVIYVTSRVNRRNSFRK